MENIISYRGFQLQVSLDTDCLVILGKVVPNENFKDLELEIGSDSFTDLANDFEEYIDEFLEQKREVFYYKNATLELSKEGGSNDWYGYLPFSRGWVFSGDSSDDIVRQFVEYINGLEESARFWNELQNKSEEIL